ncbi:MAG: biotin carboxylase N-terminal domain-containing protein [Desulfosoma sp.]
MNMIKKLLVANRGEIVRRIIRTCREMGVQTVAVFSEADRGAAYVTDADQAVCIGPANPLQSYLNIDALLDAARKTGADAVHPGYGFLSERGAFAEAVENAGMIWVGPPSKLLRRISSKCACRQIASEVGVPVVPGTLKPVADPEEILKYGRRHGYPLFLKLDKGGGGKGISRINGPEDVERVFKQASSIGSVAFGSSDCYLEHVVAKPRHIEVQFVADKHGNCVCLGERECSIQRRNQKIIEEGPSPAVSPEERALLFDWTRRIVLRMGYHGAGTIEGLRSADGSYYFMEINARLQVEHAVSEFITGLDIVKCQLEISCGMPLSFVQEEVSLSGHAIEARIYAEDPETFMPSPGIIKRLSLPAVNNCLRIDHALAENTTVPPYYDPLLAKVVAWDGNRPAAIGRLTEALKRIEIEGIKTNIQTSLKVLSSELFLRGEYDTSFLSGE